MDRIQALAIAGIILLAAAGILDYAQKGGWKLLALSLLYGIANTIIFIAR
jgi:uncharacterized membrane protein